MNRADTERQATWDMLEVCFVLRPLVMMIDTLELRMTEMYSLNIKRIEGPTPLSGIGTF